MKRICFVTGTRAEYGLLKHLMKMINDDSSLELQIIATGMHLSPEFDLTYKEIERDGFRINHKVEMLLSSDTSAGVTKSVGLGLIGFAEVFPLIKPDLVVVLGDRFELLAAATAALIFKIPIAHIHGGETTEGAFDESIRHSITKMSHYHFVAADEYRKRVIQLGEDPDRVYMVGGLGVDAIMKCDLMERESLESDIGFKFGENTLLVTFHPVTLDNIDSKDHMKELFSALDEFDDYNLLFTMPNADSDSRVIFKMIESYVRNRENSAFKISLGQKRYLSALQFVSGVIGNSSSGLLEVPTFKVGTVNIGDRQKGRLKADSVVDCLPVKESIVKGINRILSKDFSEILKNTKNPYGEGGSSNIIYSVIKDMNLEKEVMKPFFDL
jgi:GDP/UDP-N,N'-diacetylbacillosamine 2-epimerase (hydrolysing)